MILYLLPFSLTLLFIILVIILLVLNTLGIAEIIYLLATQKKIKKKETPTV